VWDVPRTACFVYSRAPEQRITRFEHLRDIRAEALVMSPFEDQALNVLDRRGAFRLLEERTKARLSRHAMADDVYEIEVPFRHACSVTRVTERVTGAAA
jgi:hypothetical protein